MHNPIMILDASHSNIVSLKVAEHSYIYDGTMNCIFSGGDFEELSNTNIHQKRNAIRQSFKTRRSFHNSKGVAPPVLNATIVLSNQCNLRCKYCVYEESQYKQYRTHNSRKLELNTAYEFLDSQIYRWAGRHVIIGFFGGEPLLEFNAIQNIVEHIRGRYESKDIGYSLTTNGMLLTTHNVEFMAKENFCITISLDGPQSIHDKYRRSRSGVATHENIMRNILQIKKEFPYFYENNIQFGATLCNAEDAKISVNWFNENRMYRAYYRGIKPDLGSGCLGTRRFNGFTRSFISAFVNAYKERHAGKIFLYGMEFLDFCMKFDRRDIEIADAPLNILPSGFCNPYSNVSILQVDGSVSFCNVIEDHRYAMVQSGQVNFDEEVLSQFREKYIAFYNSDCRLCWARHVCSLCWIHFLDDTRKPNVEKIRAQCVEERRKQTAQIELYIRLKLEDPNMFSNIREMLPNRNEQ